MPHTTWLPRGGVEGYEALGLVIMAKPFQLLAILTIESPEVERPRVPARVIERFHGIGLPVAHTEGVRHDPRAWG